MSQDRETSLQTRRSFLSLALGAAATAVTTSPVEAALRPLPERSLHLHNIHTGETVRTVYWAHGRYLPQSLARINYLLRDHRTDAAHSMDPRLLDLISTLHQKFGNRGPVHIISGYRSPETNAMLASLSGGVAHNSLHLRGMAVDISIPGASTGRLGRAARAMRAGGVGTYPASGFVHIDTGRVRTW